MTKQEQFESIEPGDKVTFLQYAGMGLKGPEYKQKTAPAMQYLCCQKSRGTVVVNLGGKFVSPGVVTLMNFVSVKKKAVAA